ncbi:hypothetical protein FKM82_030974 [Ascaphus truei]
MKISSSSSHNAPGESDHSYRISASGISAIQTFKILLFFVFLLLYIFTLEGNVLIIVLVSANHQLRTPMYLGRYIIL